MALTENMKDVLLHMADDEGMLVLHRGVERYWTTPNVVRKWGGPVWQTSTAVIAGLVRRGLAVKFLGPQARLVLTQAGWDAVAGLRAAEGLPSPASDQPASSPAAGAGVSMVVLPPGPNANGDVFPEETLRDAVDRFQGLPVRGPDGTTIGTVTGATLHQGKGIEIQADLTPPDAAESE